MKPRAAATPSVSLPRAELPDALSRLLPEDAETGVVAPPIHAVESSDAPSATAPPVTRDDEEHASTPADTAPALPPVTLPLAATARRARAYSLGLVAALGISAIVHAAAVAWLGDRIARQGEEAAQDALSVELILDAPPLAPAKPIAGAEAAQPDPQTAEAADSAVAKTPAPDTPAPEPAESPTSEPLPDPRPSEAAAPPAASPVEPAQPTPAEAPSAPAAPEATIEAAKPTPSEAPPAPAPKPEEAAAPDAPSRESEKPAKSPPTTETAPPTLTARAATSQVAPEEPSEAAEPAKTDAQQPAEPAEQVGEAPAQVALPEADVPVPTPRPEPPKRAKAEAKPQPKAKPATQGQTRAANEQRAKAAKPPAKRAQRQPEQKAAAGRKGGATAGEKAAYSRRLISHVERHKRYPRQAARQELAGAASLSITIDRRGRLAGARLARGSGHAVLDEEALAVARRAAPYPRPPEGIGGNTLSFSVTLRFKP